MMQFPTAIPKEAARKNKIGKLIQVSKKLNAKTLAGEIGRCMSRWSDKASPRMISLANPISQKKTKKPQSAFHAPSATSGLPLALAPACATPAAMKTAKHRRIDNVITAKKIEPSQRLINASFIHRFKRLRQ
jgi:hypothetical protein